MDYSEFLKLKFDFYQNQNYIQKAKIWLNQNIDKVSSLFEDVKIRDFIFEPFKDVFDSYGNIEEKDVYNAITQVALINAILAGLPGQMGVGVYVSIAFEAWMGYIIAKHIGLNIFKPIEIFKYLGMIGGSILIFKTILSGFYSLFSIVPFLNPLIFAEIFTTNLIGIALWVGFEEMKKNGSFKIPKKLWFGIIDKSKNLFLHQIKILKNLLNPKNIKIVGERFKMWFTGDIYNVKKINGEVFATVAMGYLISGHYDELKGPLSDIFLEAIRLRWSSQFDDNTSIEEIAKRFAEYSPKQLQGVINTIKGKMFELLVERTENFDNDNIKAYLFKNESHPDSDIVFVNTETGDKIAVSLKAASENDYGIIEEALQKYPNTPILTTKEVSDFFNNHPEYARKVFGTEISNEMLDYIAHTDTEELIKHIQPIDSSKVIIGGMTVSTVALVWPLLMLYYSGKIPYSKFKEMMQKIFKKQSIKVISRLSYGLIFGPVFAWYLLARSIKVISNNAIK